MLRKLCWSVIEVPPVLCFCYSLDRSVNRNHETYDGRQTWIILLYRIFITFACQPRHLVLLYCVDGVAKVLLRLPCPTTWHPTLIYRPSIVVLIRLFLNVMRPILCKEQFFTCCLKCYFIIIRFFSFWASERSHLSAIHWIIFLGWLHNEKFVNYSTRNLIFLSQPQVL